MGEGKEINNGRWGGGVKEKESRIWRRDRGSERQGKEVVRNAIQNTKKNSRSVISYSNLGVCG